MRPLILVLINILNIDLLYPSAETIAAVSLEEIGSSDDRAAEF
mgnify:CR=1 FL=1